MPWLHQRWLVWLAFSGLLLVGLQIHRDYGISWDEETSRLQNGLPNYVFLTGGDPGILKRSGERYHGPAFEIVLIFLEKGLGLEDNRSVYFLRHLVTFVYFFAAVLVFYRMLRRRFHSRMMGLVGAAFLVLSPRIFADAFYNSKDAAFLSAYVFALASLMRFLRRPSSSAAILHALACGFLIDIRIQGLVVPVLTLILIPSRWFAQRREGQVGEFPWRALAWYAGLTPAFVTLFWPMLWHNPPLHLYKAFEQMRDYPWANMVLYQGEEIPANKLPWHYLPWWMLITTPLFYVLLFAAGCGRFLVDIIRGPLRCLAQRTEDMVWAGAFFLPFVAVIGLHATVYDGWRHLYFVYPAFLFLAVLGFGTLFSAVRMLTGRRRTAVAVFLAACAVPLAVTAWQMVRVHPYQNLYFNDLAGPDMQTIKSRYELDYWGLSCREGLENLLSHDSSSVIRIYAETTPVAENLLLLPPAQQARVRLTSDPAEADYYLSHFRWHRSEFPAARDACSVRVGNAKVFVAQKLH